MQYFPLILTFLYFFIRLFNLLSLPIFNDESIYLHWGQIMVNAPNQQFYSLFDGKPPLFLWNLGIFQKLPIDPLISGRLVSILFGFFTLVGILEICKLLKFSSKIQIITGLLYIFCPLIIFYDRLAIIDSAISTIFIWVLYFCFRISQSSVFSIQYSILLGIIQGMGLWIKGTTQIFLFLPFVVPLISYLLEKNQKKSFVQFITLTLSLTLSQLLFLPIRLNPLFKTYSKRESDFLIPFSQVFSPTNWLPHTLSLSLTLTFLVTPLVLGFAVYGFYKLLKSDRKNTLFLFLFLFLSLGIEVLTARYFLSRYYLFAIIPIIIFCGYGLGQIKKYFLPIFVTVIFFPLSLTLALTLNPLATLKTLSQNHTLESDLSQYYTGWPSGYGVGEAIKFLQSEANKGQIVVVVRADSGNPEDAVYTYLGNNKNILLARATRAPTKEELAPIQNFPIYFVSRGEQYLNMKSQLQEVKIYKKPSGIEFVGIYKIVTK